MNNNYNPFNYDPTYNPFNYGNGNVNNPYALNNSAMFNSVGLFSNSSSPALPNGAPMTNISSPYYNTPRKLSEIIGVDYTTIPRTYEYSPGNIIETKGIRVKFIDIHGETKEAITMAGSPIRAGKLLDWKATPVEPMYDKYREIVKVLEISFLAISAAYFNSNIASANTTECVANAVENSNTFNLSYLFHDCDRLKECCSLPVSAVKTDFMFFGCEKLNQEFIISPFVKSCVGMFGGCHSLKSKITIEGCPNISGMFYDTPMTNEQVSVDFAAIFNGFAHYLKPHAELMNYKLKERGTPGFAEISDWGEPDSTVTSTPVNVFGEPEPPEASESDKSDAAE